MIHVASSRRRPRRGAIIVHMVLCLTALFGVMAVALDGGMLLAERRHGQATADAAALAGAADLFKNYMTTAGVDSGTAATSANTTATANGYTAANSTVTVRVYPANYLGGPHAGTQVPQGYIEVTVTYNQARFFSAMWGSSSIPISARAVARGQWVASSPAILALDPSADGALTAKGHASITATGGGSIIVDSNSASSIDTTGSGNVTASGGGKVYVSGADPGGNVSPSPPVTNQPPTPDPLRFLPAPSKPANAAAPTTSGGVTTYYPGYYPSGISPSGTTVLTAGTYYIDNGFSTNGATVTGSGVMLYLNSGSLDMAGNGDVSLNPPTSGVYANLTIFQSRSDTTTMTLHGNGSLTVTGTLYAPAAQILATGNGNYQVGSQLIADTVVEKGGGNSGGITVTYDNTKVAKTRIFNLVE